MQELHRPRSLRHALELLRDDPELTPLAGCTDLYVQMQFGTLDARRFVDLWPLETLRRIETRGSTLSIGALATYTDLRRSGVVRRRIPMLAAAAAQVGGLQIQNRGTIGGNIANASPAGDTLPVLAAADATVVLQSLRGVRRVPFTAYYTGYRATVRQPDELIAAVEVPPLPRDQTFRKVGTRAAQAISKVVAAMVGGDAPRLAFGSMAPTVVRATHVERAIAAGDPLDAIVAALARDLSPIDDVRSTAEYRITVAENLLRDWITRRDR